MNISTIDEYIAQYTPEIQKKLKEIRNIIKEISPDSKEKINWGMATFTSNGKNLVYFAGQKNHLGFYSGASGVEHFQNKLGDYKTSKGGIHFRIRSLSL